MNLFRLRSGPRWPWPARWLWPALMVILALPVIMALMMAYREGGQGPLAGDPPGPAGPVRLVLWDYNWPLRPGPEGTYRQWLEGALASYKSANPGIEIDYHLIPWGLGPAQLAEAWTAGTGPDIYSGPLETIPEELQGLAPFRPDSVPGSPLPWTLPPLTTGRQVLALPRWGILEALAGDPAALKAAGVDVGEVASRGWTYEEFAATAKKIGKTRYLGRKVWGLVSDQDGRLIHGLVASAGFPRLLDPLGRPAWPAGAVRDIIEPIRPLVSDGSIALASPGRESMLELYLAKRTGMVGPVGPWMLRAMEERKARGLSDARETRLLPFPGHSRENSRALVSLTVLAVRRDPADRGGRKTQAATLLARHLAAASEAPANRLGAVWAYQGGQATQPDLEALVSKAVVIPAQAGSPGGPGVLVTRKDLSQAAGLMLKGKIDPDVFLNLVAPPQ